MHEHDGYAPHSHEVRPDHGGVSRTDGTAAAAFAALEAIESGGWDRYLLRLRAAIEQRRATEAYSQHIVAGAR